LIWGDFLQVLIFLVQSILLVKGKKQSAFKICLLRHFKQEN
jgi:hypothetical protein